MRGPSSSHTAASWRIAAAARALFGEQPRKCIFLFDRDGSYGKVYQEQGADRAFAAGLLGIPLTDGRFFSALDEAKQSGLDIIFDLGTIHNDTHPNAVLIAMQGRGGASLIIQARSTGGGAFEITSLDEYAAHMDGRAHELLVFGDPQSIDCAVNAVRGADAQVLEQHILEAPRGNCGHVRTAAPVPERLVAELCGLDGVAAVRSCPALLLPLAGAPLGESAAELVAYATERGWSLGRVGVEYEAALTGMSADSVRQEMSLRLDVMLESVRIGLDPSQVENMLLLTPTAKNVLDAEKGGRPLLGGPQTRAAARALAAMHASSAMQVVVAAPTGGSAGVLPGLMASMLEDLNFSRETVVESLFAAGVVGLVVLFRGNTFAAEVAGCQVEIGAAGAMGAAALADALGGSAAHAADAAAIALQNTMGSVCDLVQGAVEIPCHTRNAVAASAAFTNADIILGGYINPIPLDDTADASHASGRMLPAELRCTALGGLATTKAAKTLPKRIR